MEAPCDAGLVGPGALGGVLAARWAAAGTRVRIWARTPSQERSLVGRGFAFEGPRGPRRRVGRGLLSARREGFQGCSAVFLCVKAPDLAAAARALRGRVPPGAAVVALQNGVGHEALVRRAFGPRDAVIGVSFIAADRPEPGLRAHTGGDLICLARTAANGAAAARARALLKRAGWKVRLAASEERLLWTKLVFNAATNPLGALCAATNGRLADDPPLREIMRALLSEALAAARAAGLKTIADPRRAVENACRAAPRQRNSMLQDLQSGRRTEAAEILGPLLAAARRGGAAVPKLEAVSRILARLEREARAS